MNREKFCILCLLLALNRMNISSQEFQVFDTASLNRYRFQLARFGEEFRTCEITAVPFYLFGMGNRTKLLYKDGRLIKSLTGETIREWPVLAELIIPNEYKVQLTTTTGGLVSIYENEKGVFIHEDGRDQMLDGTGSVIHLPDFKGNRYNEILKVLHQEILINITDSKPVPNYFVYHNPWRRDAAMMAMCLQKTGNLHLIKDWVIQLDDPYDRNNGAQNGAPETEADNLGQSLYLLSLFTGKDHPLVQKILAEIPAYVVKDRQGTYIKGRSDFHEAPVYQTKWLKFGLIAMGLQDTFSIPAIQDNYSSLVWWDYKDSYMPGTTDACDEWKNDFYPYIGWAADHFHGLKRNPLSNQIYPLTWEKNASEADYSGMAIIDQLYVREKIAVPHTWHAAEAFLYLIDL